MKIEYNSFGDLQLLTNKHRHVLHPNRLDGEDNEIPESDVAGESAIVQAVFNAMKAVPTAGEHRMISFDSVTGIIKVDGQALTPDSDVSGFNQEVQTFFNTIYPNENAPAVKLYRAKQVIEKSGVENDG